ncbi:hypothetical protein BGZ61DRAFT_443110 [Ilyonectria robusta]|uniref:uncharacterized protein n=1 Tax=Ilyonectria robusta TaxID=1079257 RepID=UPI001E8CBE63|nr:uncharacterized protein BGZ61DRAFT_443110 [Ilyonectria robusta]KAH8734775.1 hypothetical protein BGZ61DRAFT_443110 [Ilyonectria robusta]
MRLPFPRKSLLSQECVCVGSYTALIRWGKSCLRCVIRRGTASGAGESAFRRGVFCPGSGRRRRNETRSLRSEEGSQAIGRYRLVLHAGLSAGCWRFSAPPGCAGLLLSPHKPQRTELRLSILCTQLLRAHHTQSLGTDTGACFYLPASPPRSPFRHGRASR